MKNSKKESKMTAIRLKKDTKNSWLIVSQHKFPTIFVLTLFSYTVYDMKIM